MKAGGLNEKAGCFMGQAILRPLLKRLPFLFSIEYFGITFISRRKLPSLKDFVP